MNIQGMCTICNFLQACGDVFVPPGNVTKKSSYYRHESGKDEKVGCKAEIGDIFDEQEDDLS